MENHPLNNIVFYLSKWCYYSISTINNYNSVEHAVVTIQKSWISGGICSVRYFLNSTFPSGDYATNYDNMRCETNKIIVSYIHYVYTHLTIVLDSKPSYYSTLKSHGFTHQYIHMLYLSVDVKWSTQDLSLPVQLVVKMM